MIYESKVAFTGADGKRKVEDYLVETDSLALAEAILNLEKTESDVRATSTKESNISSEFIHENGDGTFFKAKVELMDGKFETHIIEADGWESANNKVSTVAPNAVEINKMEKTPFFDVLRAVVDETED